MASWYPNDQALRDYLRTDHPGDEHVGASASRSSYADYLTPRLTGKVVAAPQPPAAPEPVSLALIGLGFAGLGWARRRR